MQRKSTNAAVRGELGIRPILLSLLSHSVKYWIYICNSDKSLVKEAYLESYKLQLPWTNSVQNILDVFKFHDVWTNQGSRYQNKIIKSLKISINNTYDEKWRNYMRNETSKLKSYCQFKSQIVLENYLVIIKDLNKRKQFARLRISAHDLHIESGRYKKPTKTPVEERTCKLCDLHEIEDEKHFILFCPRYNDLRNDLYEKLNLFTSFNTLCDNDKFNFIMSCLNGDTEIIHLIINYVNKCFDLRKNLVNRNT